MVSNIFRPRIRITSSDDIDEYYCLEGLRAIKKKNCFYCENYERFFIWRDEKFLKYCEQHEYCDYGKINPLEKGYLYYRYFLSSSAFRYFKQYDKIIKFFCCDCGRKLKLVDPLNAYNIIKRESNGSFNISDENILNYDVTDDFFKDYNKYFKFEKC